MAVVREKAVIALEALYSGPLQERSLNKAREIFAFLRANGQVRRYIIECIDHLNHSPGHENPSSIHPQITKHVFLKNLSSSST